MTSTLLIRDVDKEDFGEYECSVTNSFGSDKALLHLRRKSKKKRDKQILAMNISSRTSSCLIHQRKRMTFSKFDAHKRQHVEKKPKLFTLFTVRIPTTAEKSVLSSNTFREEKRTFFVQIADVTLFTH